VVVTDKEMVIGVRAGRDQPGTQAVGLGDPPTVGAHLLGEVAVKQLPGDRLSIRLRSSKLRQKGDNSKKSVIFCS
jgi:hypothetical protein